MHIAILADPIADQKAGIHVYTKNLCEALIKNDKKNKYTFISKKSHPFFKKITKNSQHSHYLIPRKKIPGYDSLRKFYLIPKLLKRIKPDIVLETCHIGPFRIPKTIKRGVIIHDLTPIIFPQFHTLRSTIIHKLLLKPVIKHSDFIITPSKNTKHDIQKHYKTKAKISVIHPGIDHLPKEEVPPKLSKPQIKELLKKPKAAPYILYLGTIEPRKNLETLIDAFLELKKKYNKNMPHRLILAGEVGWKSKKILQKAQNPHIQGTGYIDDKTKTNLYKNADLFIYPSIYEGFGIPPLEAMTHQIPVITSTGGSLKEIFDECALQFDPKDKKQLKSHIISLLSDNDIRRNLIKKSNKFVEGFTWERAARELMEIF